MEILEQIFLFVLGFAVLGILGSDFQLRKYLLVKLKDVKEGDELNREVKIMRKSVFRIIAIIILILLILESFEIIKELFF
jgi:hypothetical protein